MPTFCRHNRFIERCPVCSPRGQAASTSQGAGATSPPRAPRPATASRAAGGAARTALRVRHETRASDDGFRCSLVPGLRASADGERLAEEIAFSVGRLLTLAADPPGAYADARDAGDVEQAAWETFLIAYLCPTEDGDPFASIRAARTEWATGELPDLREAQLGPRTSHDAARGSETLAAFRGWAARAGSQREAFVGDEGWTAERRFERVYERLALPGLGRAARYDLLVTLGRMGLFELRGGSLQLGGDDGTVLAAKRVFGIGDRLNLESRARALAEACGAPLEALDLALFNWGSGGRASMGVPEHAADDQARERALAALGL